MWSDILKTVDSVLDLKQFPEVLVTHTDRQVFGIKDNLILFPNWDRFSSKMEVLGVEAKLAGCLEFVHHLVHAIRFTRGLMMSGHDSGFSQLFTQFIRSLQLKGAIRPRNPQDLFTYQKALGATLPFDRWYF